MNNRIKYLDGLRGIAILLVFFFHAFACGGLTDLPFKDDFRAIVVFNYGFLGVQLFFMISGFFILMTLEKSKNYIQFIFKRWLRLFPAMLLANIIVFSTATLFPERPYGLPQIQNIISGLIFVEPIIIQKLTGFDLGILEGVFWTLFVEVKFYILFGAAYFYLGKKQSVLFISLLFIGWFIPHNLGYEVHFFKVISDTLSLQNYGWFATGAVSYICYNNTNLKWLIYTASVGLLSVLSLYFDPTRMLYMLTLFTLFQLTIYWQFLQKCLENQFLLFFGFISYPLYLMHENILIATLSKLDRMNFPLPKFLYPFIPLFFLSAIAWIIVKWLDPVIKKQISNWIKK
jgi:peptidoglycan/LPS O-acetylase OafA/YrhL